MNNIQEHVEKVREALLVASPFPWKWEDGDSQCKDLGRFDDANGWTVCDFGNNAQYYPTTGKEPDETDYALIANAPQWLKDSLDIIEHQKREIDRLKLDKQKLHSVRSEQYERSCSLQRELEQQQREIERMRTAMIDVIDNTGRIESWAKERLQDALSPNKEVSKDEQ